ncbi:MAG: hypothetical protein HC822_21110, partial [Oscillochloris sp.]|nr:hypothetical protein [Oscillochloris sp.]
RDRSPPPLAPLHAALAAATPAVRRRQLERLAAAEGLAIVDRIIGGSAAPAPVALRIEQVALAIGVWMRSLAQINPLLLILDDVQWAAPDLWPMLTLLRESLAGAPALILLLARDDELRINPESRTAAEQWNAAGDPLIRLDGLRNAELDELVLACGAELDQAALAQLRTASGGSPLLALSLLRSGVPAARRRSTKHCWPAGSAP